MCAFEQASGLETWRHANAIVIVVIIIIYRLCVTPKVAVEVLNYYTMHIENN